MKGGGFAQQQLALEPSMRETTHNHVPESMAVIVMCCGCGVPQHALNAHTVCAVALQLDITGG